MAGRQTKQTSSCHLRLKFIYRLCHFVLSSNKYPSQRMTSHFLCPITQNTTSFTQSLAVFSQNKFTEMIIQLLSKFQSSFFMFCKDVRFFFFVIVFFLRGLSSCQLMKGKNNYLFFIHLFRNLCLWMAQNCIFFFKKCWIFFSKLLIQCNTQPQLMI